MGGGRKGAHGCMCSLIQAASRARFESNKLRAHPMTRIMPACWAAAVMC